MIDAYHFDQEQPVATKSIWHGLEILPRHLNEGLKAKDFSHIGHCSVLVARHDDFPYSTPLINNEKYSERNHDDFDGRVRSIEHAFLMNSFFLGIADEKALDIANFSSPCVDHSSRFMKITEVRNAASASAFAPLEIDLVNGIGGRRSSHIALPHNVADRLLNLSVSVDHAAFVMLSPADQPAEMSWLTKANIPVTDTPRVKDTRIIDRFIQFHEAGHLALARLDGLADRDKNRAEYLEETQVEAFAVRAIRGMEPLGVDVENALHNITMIRYAILLQSKHSHRIAPAIESYIKGIPLPRMDQVIETSDRLMTAAQELLHPEKNSYASLTTGETFSAIRRCLNDKKLDAKAETMASKILQAVEHFSPGFSYAPSIVRPVYPAASLG